MSKKKKIIISVIVSAVVIAMTKGKNAAKASGVYANKVADVMYQAGSTDKYSGVVEAADTMDIKADTEKTVKDISTGETAPVMRVNGKTVIFAVRIMIWNTTQFWKNREKSMKTQILL